MADLSFEAPIEEKWSLYIVLSNKLVIGMVLTIEMVRVFNGVEALWEMGYGEIEKHLEYAAGLRKDAIGFMAVACSPQRVN